MKTMLYMILTPENNGGLRFGVILDDIKDHGKLAARIGKLELDRPDLFGLLSPPIDDLSLIKIIKDNHLALMIACNARGLGPIEISPILRESMKSTITKKGDL